MPLSNPEKVADRFQKRIADVLRDSDELFIAVHDKKRQASLENMIAEQSVMLTAVLWEAFVNDLVVSYVIRAPRTCLNDVTERFRQSTNEKFAGATRWISLNFPPELSQTQVEKLLDPKGWNITAKSAQGLAELANRHLSAVDAKRFSLEADDRDFIDYLVALRNYLGHRSDMSREELIDSIGTFKPTGSNADLIAPIHTVAVYLKQAIGGAGRRVNVIGRRLSHISAKLV